MAASLKTLVPRLVIALFLLFSISEAKEFWLNGKHNSWKIPSSPDEFTKWAQKLRFRVGDSLVVEYDPKSDSILEVNAVDYKNCTKSNPIKSYQDGKNSIDLGRSGWFYFISGADGHCEKGQKLALDVLNEKHASSKASPSPPPASPPSSDDASGGDASGGAAPTPAVIVTATSDALGLRTTTMAALGTFLVMATLIVSSLVY